MTADDFYFTRTGFVSEILSVKDEFCILGHDRPPIEAFAGVYENEDSDPPLGGGVRLLVAGRQRPPHRGVPELRLAGQRR